MNALRGFGIDPAMTGGVTLLPSYPAASYQPAVQPLGPAQAAWGRGAQMGDFTQPAAAPSGDPAQRIVAGLVARGIPETAAIGIAGNLGAESRFDSGINEISPVVRGSRGGFGLAQWTGPRRRALEAFAASRGVPVDNEDMQLDFLVGEMRGAEARNSRDTLAAATPEQAAYEFMDDFLRPGVANGDHRMTLARRIAGGEPMPYGGSGGAGRGSDRAGTGTPASSAMPRTGAFAAMASALSGTQAAPPPILDVQMPLVAAPAPLERRVPGNALAGFAPVFETLRGAFT